MSSGGDITVRSLIDRYCDHNPDGVFALFPESGRALSWHGLRQAARRVGDFAAAHDIPAGAPLGFMAGNGYSALQMLLGTLYSSRVCLPLNLLSSNRQIAYMLEQSNCRHVVADQENRDRLEAIVAEFGLAVQVFAVSRDDGLQPAHERSEQTEEPAADSRALLMYTSGTTGLPKGVVHTHKSVLAGGGNVALAHQLGTGDRALCVLPLYHINGQCVTVFAPLVSGGSVVMPHRFRTERFWPLISEHRCTWFSVVPTLISYLLHAEASPMPAQLPLRFGRSASAPLSPAVQESFEQRFKVPIIETMGLTETAAQILSNPLPPAARKIGSPGIAYGNEVIVLKDGRPCPPLMTGELAVRGDNVMREYHDSPEETRAAFSADGWLLTGDLGYCDEAGFFFVTGRRKELIIKGGENIAPREIDEALLALPQVVEAAAFARPCERYGQRIEACVVLREGERRAEKDLIAHCHQVLGAYKSPDRIYFMVDLPKGPSGKVQRLKLPELLENNP